MKHHIMISLGLLLGALFSYRLANALTQSPLGLWHLYLLGGVVLASWLIYAGLKERRHARQSDEDNP